MAFAILCVSKPDHQAGRMHPDGTSADGEIIGPISLLPLRQGLMRVAEYDPEGIAYRHD